jgi:hypothetical protein
VPRRHHDVSYRTISKRDLVELLSDSLGDDKSDEIVDTAIRRLDISEPPFSPPDVRAIFDELSGREGLVGVVARSAVSRGEVERITGGKWSSARMRIAKPHDPCLELEALLSPALGPEKARSSIEGVARRCNLDEESFSREDALFVLDELSKEEGIVGVVAKFARPRLASGASPRDEE